MSSLRWDLVPNWSSSHRGAHNVKILSAAQSFICRLHKMCTSAPVEWSSTVSVLLLSDRGSVKSSSRITHKHSSESRISLQAITTLTALALARYRNSILLKATSRAAFSSSALSMCGICDGNRLELSFFFYYFSSSLASIRFIIFCLLGVRFMVVFCVDDATMSD